MTRIGWVFVFLVLVGCGDSTERGSIGWDSAEALIVISGPGQYQLELNNNGAVPVDFTGGEGWPVKTLAPGASQRIHGEGTRTFRFANASGKKAVIDYVFIPAAGAELATSIP